MLCAQALAVVAQTAARLKPHALFEVLTNADDVQRDLIVWASERGYAVERRTTGTLRLRPDTSRHGTDVRE